MITKEQYLKALKIVEEYHCQLKNEIEEYHCQLKNEIEKQKTKLNDIGLKRGNYVVYVGGSESKYLTKNKQYRLTREPSRNKILIINDKGKRMICNQAFFNTL